MVARAELPSFLNKEKRPQLIEADVLQVVRAVPLSFYGNSECGICRPFNLNREDREQLVQYAIRVCAISTI